MEPIPSDFVWSFSKLSSYLTCPRAFYIENVEHGGVGVENAYGQYGTLAHKLLEEFLTGELTKERLPAAWEDRYADYVKSNFPAFPKGQGEKNYNAGLEYFTNFQPFDVAEILEVEEKFSLRIGAYPFHGIADLVYRDHDGGIVVVDHKTKSLASMKKERELYTRQLYIYAAHVYDKYGEYPKLLKFNMIKSGTEIVEEFDPVKYAGTLQWAEDLIDEIYMDTEFAEHVDSFFCGFICDVRDVCE